MTKTKQYQMSLCLRYVPDRGMDSYRVEMCRMQFENLVKLYSSQFINIWWANVMTVTHSETKGEFFLLYIPGGEGAYSSWMSFDSYGYKTNTFLPQVNQENSNSNSNLKSNINIVKNWFQDWVHAPVNARQVHFETIKRKLIYFKGIYVWQRIRCVTNRESRKCNRINCLLILVKRKWNLKLTKLCDIHFTLNLHFRYIECIRIISYFIQIMQYNTERLHVYGYR